jgi:hypothetical protein
MARLIGHRGEDVVRIADAYKRMTQYSKNPLGASYGSYHRSQNPWIGREIVTALENPLGRSGAAAVLVSAAVLAGAIAFAFWPKKAEAAKAPAASGTVNLTEVDNGKSLVMAVGAVLYVRLAFQGDTGYTWSYQQITSNPASPPLEQEETPEEGTIVRYEGGTRPGDAQFAVVRFTARRPGAAKVHAQLQRGGAGAPARVFEVSVTVVPAEAVPVPNQGISV